MARLPRDRDRQREAVIMELGRSAATTPSGIESASANPSASTRASR